MQLWELALLIGICVVPLLLIGATKLIAHTWFAAKREHTRQMLREFTDDNHH